MRLASAARLTIPLCVLLTLAGCASYDPLNYADSLLGFHDQGGQSTAFSPAAPAGPAAPTTAVATTAPETMGPPPEDNARCRRVGEIYAQGAAADGFTPTTQNFYRELAYRQCVEGFLR